MDIYSHELRGPFCVVMQSAEGILRGLAYKCNDKPLDPESGDDPDVHSEST